jgi:tRNA (cmo5U34)-methyltransferase
MATAETPNPIDFDANPPVPVDQYDDIVRRVNVGYDLIFVLTQALLRALGRSALELLVVGAGGGTELVTFGPANPSWRFTGVDPSAAMLAAAQRKAEAAGLSERIQLRRGTVADLPPDQAFDAATCISVLHFVPDDGHKLQLLQGIGQHLRPGAPLILVSPVAPATGEVDAFAAARREYSAALGLSDAMREAIQAQARTFPPNVTEERHRALLHEAGFAQVTRFFSAFTMTGWVAR